LTLCNKKISLGNQEIAMIWYAGLVRGSVAFALSFSITTKHAADLRIIVLFVTLLTCLVLVSYAQKFREFVGIEVASGEKKNE
jgi:hypothetical protein